MVVWDPSAYLRFSDERSRPFFDLVARVRTDPATVVGLGCGPGTLTLHLARRWPTARVLGLDASSEMIAAARERVDAKADATVRFAVLDVREWDPTAAIDAFPASGPADV